MELTSNWKVNVIKQISQIKFVFILILIVNTSEIYSQALDIITPAKGDILSCEDTVKIIWNIIDYKVLRTIDSVVIEFSFDNGATWEKIDSISAVNDEISLIGNIYIWKQYKQETRIAKIRLSDKKTKDILGLNKGNFIIMNELQKPMILFTFPDSVSEFYTREKVNISWKYKNIPDNEHVSLYYTTNFGKNWNFISKKIPIVEGNFVWEVPDEVSDLCMIKIIENSNNVSELSFPFTITKKIPVGDLLRVGFGSTVGFNELRLNSLYMDLNFYKTFKKFNLFGLSLSPLIDFNFLYGKNALSDTTIYSQAETSTGVSNSLKLVSNRNKSISVLSMIFALTLRKPSILRGVYFGIYSEYRQEGFKIVNDNNGNMNSNDTSSYASFTGLVLYHILEDNNIEFKISYAFGHDFGSNYRSKVIVNGYNIRIGLRHKKYSIKIGAEINGEYGRAPNEEPRTFMLFFAKDISISSLYELLVK